MGIEMFSGLPVLARLRVRVLACCTLTAFVLLSYAGTRLQAQDAMSLFEQGFAKFQERNFGAAKAAFERAFALEPSNDIILSFVEKVTVAAVFQMVRSEDPQVSAIGRELLRLSRERLSRKQSDPEARRAAVDETLSAESQRRLVLMIRHASVFGRNLVPLLIPILGDSDLERRTTAFNWISLHIGMDAVPVLQAGRKHPLPMVRRNIAALLGVRPLRHITSLGTLQAMVETDESQAVREAAQESVRAILSEFDGSVSARSAKRYFVDNAYRYYLRPYRNTFARRFYTPTIYRLEGDKIAEEEVAPFQLSPRMAMQNLDSALELDPAYLAARVLNLCNDAAQIVSYDRNREFYSVNDSDRHIREVLNGQARYVDYVLRLRVLSAPPALLFRGLSQALKDERSDVARKLIATIRDTERSGDVPESLVAALEDTQSRLVRVGAAITLAYWNPLRFDAGEQVVGILESAVAQGGVRTAQLVIGDRRRANRFSDLLRELNLESYSPLPTIERAYGVITASPPDVVLMDEVVQTAADRADGSPINVFVNELRKDYRTADVPVVVLVTPARLAQAKELYESEQRKVMVVPDNIDRLGLKNGVFDVLFRGKDDAKSFATQVAGEAAAALAYLGSVPSSFPVQRAVDTLTAVLRNRPDSVRLPSIRALGAIGDESAVQELAVTFANEENPPQVRAAAMWSVGKVLSGSATEDVLRIIQDGMEHSDLSLRRAAWFAFSNAGASASAAFAASRAQPPAAAAGGPAAPEAVEDAGAEEAVEAVEAEAELEVEEFEEAEVEVEDFDEDF